MRLVLWAVVGAVIGRAWYAAAGAGGAAVEAVGAAGVPSSGVVTGAGAHVCVLMAVVMAGAGVGVALWLVKL